MDGLGSRSPGKEVVVQSRASVKGYLLGDRLEYMSPADRDIKTYGILSTRGAASNIDQSKIVLFCIQHVLRMVEARVHPYVILGTKGARVYLGLQHFIKHETDQS